MTFALARGDRFYGIFVRLQRADENISNLKHEIARFFQECEHPIVPDHDNERWHDAVEYHKTLFIPRRFSVLAGEIIHHWRSCLDHIVWEFSSPQYRIDFERTIQFPILVDTPNSDELKRFKRQIGGIPDPSPIRDLIDKLQPYHLGKAAQNDPLAIIGGMDIFDKHRELVITRAIANLHLAPDTPMDVIETFAAAAALYEQGKPLSAKERASISTALGKLHDQGKVSPQIAFADFGGKRSQPLIPSLTKLSNHMEGVVGAFVDAAK